MTKFILSELRRRHVLERRPLDSATEAALLADPRPGAKAILNAIARRHFDSRSEGQRIRKLLRFEMSLWKTGVQFVAGVEREGFGEGRGHGTAVRRADGQRAGRAGHGQRDGAVGPQREAAEGDLQRRRIARIADAEIGLDEGMAVERARFRHALIGAAGTAAVLIERRTVAARDAQALLWRFGLRRGLLHGGDGRAFRDVAEAHPVAGGEQRRLGARRVPHLDRRIAENLPAAGAVGRIDAAELAADGD